MKVIENSAVRLLEFARKAEMPDARQQPVNPEVTATVVGRNLGNDHGNSVHESGFSGWQEYVVRLKGGREVRCDINLANLLKLATIGAEAVLENKAPAPDPRTHITGFDPIWNKDIST